MASRRLSAKSVFSSFKKLTCEQQAEFFELARWDDGDNLLKREMLLREDADAAEASALGDALTADMLLHRMKRKPDMAIGMDVVRLKDEEGLSFGRIGKRLKPQKSYDAVRKLYHRTKKRLAAGQ